MDSHPRYAFVKDLFTEIETVESIDKKKSNLKKRKPAKKKVSMEMQEKKVIVTPELKASSDKL